MGGRPSLARVLSMGIISIISKSIISIILLIKLNILLFRVGEHFTLVRQFLKANLGTFVPWLTASPA